MGDVISYPSEQVNSSIPIGTNGQTVRYVGHILTPTSFLYNSGSRVGVGTTSPGYTFDVTGLARFSTGFLSPKWYPVTDSTTALSINKADGTTNIVTIDTTNSRVGIGTSAPANILNIYTTSGVVTRYDISTANTNGLTGLWNFYTNSAVSPDYFGGFGYKLDGGSTDTYKKFVIHISNSSTPKFVINNNGFIGITSVTNPSYAISVSGQNAFTIGGERNTTANTAGVNMTLLAPGATTGATNKKGGALNYYDGLSTGNATGISHQWFTSDATTSGTADQAQTAKVTILNNGNVGFGVIPSYKVHVSGEMFATGNVNGSTGSFTSYIFTPAVLGSTSAAATLLLKGSTNATPGNIIMNTTGGNIGIGTTTPTAKVSVAEKTALTETGAVMVMLTNKTGANSVKGTVVAVSSTTDNAFMVNPLDGDMPIGVVYTDGIADGSECWVVISGIAEVLLVDTVASTRSYVAFSSGTTAGRIDTSATIPAASQHFREVGHTLESKTGGTNVLCKCIIHFN